MLSAVADHEAWVRFGSFVLVFAAMALCEALAPRRRRSFTRRDRWPHNLGLLLADVLALRLIAPGAAIAVGLAAETGGWGLLGSLSLPAWVGVPLAVVLLDLAIYFQHVAFHAVPMLWRLHRVHHTDLDFDVTTGTRFHPMEILVSVALKCGIVAAIGAPAVAVLAFEVLLNATAVFNHANAALPQPLERRLRWLVVTPDMHRVHHSILYNETNSNFGFNLPWWDRLFGTYRAQPAAGHQQMTIGVDAFRARRDLRLDRLLVQPLIDTSGGYAINRRPEPPRADAWNRAPRPIGPHRRRLDAVTTRSRARASFRRVVSGPLRTPRRRRAPRARRRRRCARRSARAAARG